MNLGTSLTSLTRAQGAGSLFLVLSSWLMEKHWALCAGCGLWVNGKNNQRDDALKQPSYPINFGKYLVYIPLSLVRIAPHFAEANPPT